MSDLDKKIKDLSILETSENTDEIVIDDVSSPDATKTKKQTKQNFLKEIVLEFLNYYTKTESDDRYLQSFTESDPTVASYIKSITATNISNWNSAFGWGNHAGLYDTLGSASSAVSAHTSAFNHSLIATALQSETDPLSLHLDQTTPQTITATDVTITATDEIYYGDVTDSTKIKKDTVQGILDLVPSPDLSGYVPYTGATGDVDLGVHGVILTDLQAKTSAGLSIKADNGDTAVLIGAGGGKNATFYDGVKLDAGTASRVLVTDANKNITQATMTATDLDAIPSSYLKLDQTTPQTVDKGAPIFKGGLYIDDTGTYDFANVLGVPAFAGLHYDVPHDTLSGGGVGMALIVNAYYDPYLYSSAYGLGFGVSADARNGGIPGVTTGLFGFATVRPEADGEIASYIQGGFFGGAGGGSGIASVVQGGFFQASLFSTVTSDDEIAAGTFKLYTDADTTANKAYGAHITNVIYGTVTDLAGLVIDDIDDGTNNWAIKTGLGKVEFGDEQEIRAGLTTTGAILKLGTKEPTVVANDILGRINFYAPLEASGTDAILVGASIVALAEAEFTSSVNKTSLQFRTGASEVATTKMTILSSGNVGIGTTAPSTPLDVVGDITSRATIGGLTRFSVSANNSQILLGASAELQLTGVNGGTINGYAGANKPLNITTSANNNNIVLTPDGTGCTILNGNVGIGTTSPANITNGFGGSGQLDKMTIYDNTAGKTTGLVIAGDGGSAVQFTDDAYNPTADFGFYAPDIWFVNRVANGGLKFVVNSNTEVLNILNNTNVGIGTTNPTGKLSVVGNTDIVQMLVKGSATQSTKNLAEWQSSDGTVMCRIQPAGNFYTIGAVNSDSVRSNYYQDVTGTAGYFQFANGAGTTLISERGNTTEPGLVVKGGSGQTGDIIQMQDSSSAVLFNVTSAGKVGIGTTTPTAYLHIKAGTATAGTAPLKFTSGTLNTTAEAGAVEYLTDNLHFTIATGTARKGIVLDDGTRLTSGKIPVATTNGRLIDVTAQTELTDEDATATDGTDATQDQLINNMRTRINELETKLTALGLLVDAD
jgi:hypothetical protein